jgi:uncharacterized protein YndB with AHSA1/START domain
MVSKSSIVHSTFSLERVYDAVPAQVYAAFADLSTKRRWMVEGEGWEVDEYTMDFRVGGIELGQFRYRGGPVIRNNTVYQDIVPDQRIVFAYTMTVDDRRISASLATVELLPIDERTRLTYTEQGAYFDGADGPREREEGSRGLLESLAQELRSPGRGPGSPPPGRRSTM